MKIPNHVAIILDGNGRWARAQGKPRSFGHIAGAKNVETICEAAYDLGIKYLTVYAFSTENWSRPKEEVDQLMGLLSQYLKNCLKTAKKNNMRVRIIGDVSALNSEMQERIKSLEEATKDYSGLNFTVALNYGSQDEILRAVNRLKKDIESGILKGQEITKDMLEAYLDTRGLPDPDLMIRTSGEMRLSNFLLWQLAYSEFYFTEVPWPAFGKEELIKALSDYSERDRRFGGV
ncbi:MAG: isoprenyl transferase [Lachnospiraceae bacterium]|nr:isoprenyl transferase [Lachnospiraceae bacterium]